MQLTTEEVLRRTTVPVKLSLTRMTSYLHLVRTSGNVKDILAKAGVDVEIIQKTKQNKTNARWEIPHT